MEAEDDVVRLGRIHSQSTSASPSSTIPWSLHVPSGPHLDLYTPYLHAATKMQGLFS
jgi:hypothetical protein